MTPHQPFRRHAESYDKYNLVQTRVVRTLAAKVAGTPSRLVDLGCGSGGFFKAYERPFTSYLAIDLAPEMLAIHPEGPGVQKWVGDFNDAALFESLEDEDFDLLVSSSALQWAKDLDWTLGRIAQLRRPVALAIFTAGTFATLHRVGGTRSPIRSREETVALLQKHFDVRIELLTYRLYFRDTLSMLRYIKRSGVSGGRRLLDYATTKRLLRDYPLPYLEFEVVTAVSTEACRPSLLH
ncbi:methyltransferase domain-containing protein [Hydrogenimonas sp.]